ncbi:MAG: sulfate ABC transporter substrate-binding protein, partial [Proteobacteria bacterium]|nr:sulfate ABC transporter substrate-binding protein [Pseudomonadota bacterium]
MTMGRVVSRLGLTAALLMAVSPGAFAQTSILNASYDVSRELYKDINPAFAASWKKSSGNDIEVKQSHGGSTKQAQSVAEGLEADVVTLNQPTDLDFLVSKGVVSNDWRTKFPHGASPYTTTTVFLVRKGNPKAIADWDDLAKPGISVVIPNPKTSGNGRYTYLAAWGYAHDKLGSDDKARDFVSKLFANVPVFDGGGRGATTSFTQRAIGDVLVTFENEAALIKAEVDGQNFDVVYPSVSVEAAPPIAIVNTIVEKHKTADAAKACLDFLYS